MILVFIDSVGIVMAIVVGIMLLNKKTGKQTANKLLGTLLLLSGMTLLNEMLVSSGISNRFQWLYFIPIYFPLSLAPLFYLFIRSKLMADFSLRSFQSLHLILPLAQALVYLGIGFRDIGFKSHLWENSHFPLYMSIESALFPLSLLLYGAAARRLLQEDTETSFDWQKDMLNWLKQFSSGILIMGVIESLYLIAELCNLPFQETGTLVLFLHSLILSAFIFWVAINGVKQQFPVYIYTPSVAKSGSQLPEDELDHWTQKILELMTNEKLFLNPDLTLKMMANYLGSSEKTLSHVINKGMNCNFSTFVNRYRVEETQQRLREKAYQQFTLTSIAFACGFDSKSTFNRVFKQETGLTPSGFIQSLEVPKSDS
ncbi:MAG: helix-turn-helix domain-containing protein [Bacteroidota bacterium]